MIISFTKQRVFVNKIYIHLICQADSNGEREGDVRDPSQHNRVKINAHDRMNEYAS